VKPPGKTTLNRMLIAAQRELERIENAEDCNVAAGLIKAPRPERVRLRDDFAGIVRLIDAIFADQVLLERVQQGMARFSLPTNIVAGEAEAAADVEEADAA
jgi:hypothetical protein